MASGIEEGEVFDVKIFVQCKMDNPVLCPLKEENAPRFHPMKS